MTQKKSKTKNTQRCTQDIRSIPPARYALPEDGRKAAALCKERWMLMMLLSTWANPDGSGIMKGVPTLAKTLRWSQRTIQRRLKDLRTLGVLVDGEIDGTYHTRTRSIDIGRVTDSTETPVTDSRTPVTDSPKNHDRFEGTRDRLTGNRDRLTKQSALPSYNRPSTVPLTVGAAAGGLGLVVSGSDSPTTKNAPLGGCGTLSPEALAKRAAREKAEEDARWKHFTSKKEWLAFVEDAASRLDCKTEIITEFLPNGGYRVLLDPMLPSIRNGVLVGYVPRSLRGKKTRITDDIYICRYDKCENHAGAMSLYCPKHEYGYEHSTQATVTVLDNSPVAAETGSCQQ